MNSQNSRIPLSLKDLQTVQSLLTYKLKERQNALGKTYTDWLDTILCKAISSCNITRISQCHTDGSPGHLERFERVFVEAVPSPGAALSSVLCSS